jgi:uncharacterized Zn-binding protein involved in type VI secretion
MGPAAARVSDWHTCPAVTANVPHVGGGIDAPCSPTVRIDTLPAARQTDLLNCEGPPDAICQGSSTVFIDKLPAARVGDPTTHGGVITLGSHTVYIGG